MCTITSITTSNSISTRVVIQAPLCLGQVPGYGCTLAYRYKGRLDNLRKPQLHFRMCSTGGRFYLASLALRTTLSAERNILLRSPALQTKMPLRHGLLLAYFATLSWMGAARQCNMPETGTLASGDSSSPFTTITLGATASPVDDYYTGFTILIDSGAGRFVPASRFVL